MITSFSIVTMWHRVLESRGSKSDAELLLESQRIEAEAVVQELMHQLESAKQMIDQLLATRKKYQKEIIKLENECRRLDTENHQLREELSALQRRPGETISRNASPSSKVSICAQASPSEPRKDQRPALLDISRKLTEIHIACCHYAPKLSSCLSVLRRTREDHAAILDTLQSISTAWQSSKPRFKAASLPDSFEEDSASNVSEAKEECERLWTEIQELTDTEFDEHLFKGSGEFENGFLVHAPVHSTVDSMKVEIHTLQERLQATNKLLKLAPPRHRKSYTHSVLTPRVHRHTTSLIKAYHRALSQPWSLLV